MKRKYSNGEKRRIIIDFIKKNPYTTYREIRKKIKLHPERIFRNGLRDAFEEAGVKPPRTFEVKTKEEKKKIIIDYIKKNPNIGGHRLKKETKINFQTLFRTLKDAYVTAKVRYPRNVDKRTKEEKIRQIIELVNENNLISILEITNRLHLNPYRFFKNFQEIYKKAGIREIKGSNKRVIKKQVEVINFIKQNPLVTQREINNKCNTHVQDIFKEGIKEAYQKAKTPFPFKRLKLYGTALKEIKRRAKNFEDKIAIQLSGYGRVNRLVKTKRGFADIILERKDKKIIIEVKDYQNKDISVSQINQLNKYLEDCNSNMGFLICRKKPKKDKFLIDGNRIFVLEESELKNIPKLINGSVV